MNNRTAASSLHGMNALAILGCSLALAGSAVAAPRVTEVRLLSVGKAEATLSVELDMPGSISVSWGESPGTWAGSAESAAAEAHHQLLISGLAPDTRMFYQLSVGGEPQPDMFTFRSGRSWVTRRASILVTADLPQGAAGEAALAERLFAEESDALLLLGAGGGTGGAKAIDPAALRMLHLRSMAEKVVVVVDATSPTRLDVADVRVITDGALPPTDDGNCWRVALGDRAPAGAEVVISRGTSPSIALTGDAIRIVLADPEEGDPERGDGATAAARAYVRLDFADGHLVATLRSADGSSLGKAELTRACAAPAPKPGASAAHAPDGDAEFEPGSSDGDADVSDCELK